MPNSSFSASQEFLAELDQLASTENLTKSEIIRTSVEKYKKFKGEQKVNTTLANKASTVVDGFFDKVAKSSDNDWLTIRNSAGDLFNKYATLKRCPSANPSPKEIAMAVAAEASDPDAVSNPLVTFHPS
ncbi:ribbon-helix-helix domain-containing protein [Shimia abyssi]|uniref:Uncharacterized protein n=1 Tax=Shimia abyssi TaxID=1662395 RepID=A0A2P8FIQ5_9RHOB|nr:ribbon-helix-helix domain-containing protein [Shimia abyssi]PSL21588.1 hypothetical protein CLV88_10110 [Shimia abyssi]